jgi:hypothetical protein
MKEVGSGAHFLPRGSETFLALLLVVRLLRGLCQVILAQMAHTIGDLSGVERCAMPTGLLLKPVFPECTQM